MNADEATDAFFRDYNRCSPGHSMAAPEGVGYCLAVKKPNKIENWITQYGADKIILGADVKDGFIHISGWKENSSVKLFDFLDSYQNKGINNILCTDINKDGTLKGPATSLYRQIMSAYPDCHLIASGGISSIDQVTDTMILRPLIVTDKQDIIDECRKIGTVEIAESMPEYCGVISQKPTTHAKLDDILEEEKKFNFKVIDKAVEDTVCTDIRDIAKETDGVLTEVTTVTSIAEDETVIDIRSQDEVDDEPLTLPGVKIINIQQRENI